MKTKLIFAAAAVVLIAGCKEEPVKAPEQAVVLNSLDSKMSYIVGYNTAKQAKANGLELDSVIIAAALKDVEADKEPRLTEEAMRETITAFQEELQKQKQEELSAMTAKNAEAGKVFLEENAKKEGVVQTESGLQYEIITAGEGVSPKADDMVLVNYRGTHLDGTEFDASANHGGAVKFPVSGLIPGWVEGLQLMSKGAKWKLYVPGDLAYGAGGKLDMRTRQYDIEPNELLIFELELLDINPVDEPAKTEEAAK